MTGTLEEFTAEADSESTSPATNEAEGGEIITWATVLPLFEDDPPPQPAARLARSEMVAILTMGHESKVLEKTLPRWFRIRPIDINIEEFSV